MPRIQHKRGTSANLASVNPTPLAGELLVVSDENALVIGNGVDAYTSLAYVTATPRSHTHPLSEISDLNIKSPGSPMLPYDVALSYNYVNGTWATKEIGLVGVGNMPTGGWPTGSLGAALAAPSTPTAHKSTHAMSGSDPLFWYDIGASSATHAAEHAVGGSDVLTPAAIGAAPAASPTFTGVITVSAGTAAAPAIAASGDANTGAFFPAADTFAISTAGVERLRVRADGNVAIGGTGAATQRFLIGGDISGTGANLVSAAIGAAQASVTSLYVYWSEPSVASDCTLSVLSHYYAQQGTVSGAVTTQYGFFAASSLTAATTNIGFYSNLASASGRWNFYANGTASNYFAGQVQCGVGSAASPAVSFNADQDTGIYRSAANCLSISTGSSERVRVDSSGRLAVATDSPTAMLDINADKIRLRTAKTPASASDTGNAGDICWDANYLYICIASGTWRRVAHSTW